MFPEKTITKPASPKAVPPAPEPKPEIKPKPETPKAVPAGLSNDSVARTLSFSFSFSRYITLARTPFLSHCPPPSLARTLTLSSCFSHRSLALFLSMSLAPQHVGLFYPNKALFPSDVSLYAWVVGLFTFG